MNVVHSYVFLFIKGLPEFTRQAFYINFLIKFSFRK